MLKNSNSKQAEQNFIGSKVLKTIKESLTIVETNRIKDTKSILKRHKKMTSSELSLFGFIKNEM